MNQIQDIYKQLNSLQDQIYNIAKMTLDQANQITPIVQDSAFLLQQIERHNDLIATMRNEIDNLKAEIQRQGESLTFLKQTVSH
jgi:uncharacterized protein YoxC